MKVAHVITRMIVGGAQENTLFNCLDLMNDFGDEVLLITGPAEGPEGKLLEEGRAGGLKVVTVDSLRRAIHPIRDWNAYRQLRNLLEEWKPDVVHTHSAKGGMLGRAAAWGLPGTIVVHTVHGAPFHPYQSWLARRFFIACERWAARRCHHLVSVADAMTDLMVGARVAPRSKFTTIYSGMEVEPLLHADDHRKEMRQQLGFADHHVVFGKIARLFHLKGHEYLIEAARLMADDLPDVRFLLVGDGILRKPFEDRIDKLGLSDRFVFTGLVPPESIPRYLGAMDALVHTSLREGLARALPQALIAGKPVISYDIDGAREVIIDGETGYLLRPKAIESLSEAIRRIALSPELRRRMGATGQLRFTDPFRHQTMTKRIRELYESLIASVAAGQGRGL